MDKRPAGIAAFVRALVAYRLPPGALERFGAPVYFSYGSLTNSRWHLMAERLARVLPDFRSELYEGLHHLNTSHQAEPARVANALRRLWQI
jgi:hypothetical protein